MHIFTSPLHPLPQLQLVAVGHFELPLCAAFLKILKPRKVGNTPGCMIISYLMVYGGLQTQYTGATLR